MKMSSGAESSLVKSNRDLHHNTREDYGESEEVSCVGGYV